MTRDSTQARARAADWGRTFQISQLAMQDTVLENAVLGALGGDALTPGTSGRLRFPIPIWWSVRKSRWAALVCKKRHDSVVAELSHGQRRQLEVAVALTLQPKAFVMDEPMAGLGTGGSKAPDGLS